MHDHIIRPIIGGCLRAVFPADQRLQELREPEVPVGIGRNIRIFRIQRNILCKGQGCTVVIVALQRTVHQEVHLIPDHSGGMVEGLLRYHAVLDGEPLTVQRVGAYHGAVGLGGEGLAFPVPGAIHIPHVLQVDGQPGQQLIHPLILVLADDLDQNRCTGALRAAKIPQARRPPIVSFGLEAVNAADLGKVIGLIDRIFVFVKAKAGEIVTEVIRPFHGNTDLRIDHL